MIPELLLLQRHTILEEYSHIIDRLYLELYDCQGVSMETGVSSPAPVSARTKTVPVRPHSEADLSVPASGQPSRETNQRYATPVGWRPHAHKRSSSKRCT